MDETYWLVTGECCLFVSPLQPSSTHIHTITEYAERSSLKSVLLSHKEKGTQMELQRAASIARDITKGLSRERERDRLRDSHNTTQHSFSGLSFLHSQGVIHRDIACRNILLTGVCVCMYVCGGLQQLTYFLFEQRVGECWCQTLGCLDCEITILLGLWE